MSNARSECLSLSGLIYKKLPRKTRDLIYGYLCLDDRHIPVGPYYHYRPYDSRKQHNDKNSEESKPEPHTEEWYIEKLTSSHAKAQTIQPDGRIRTDHDVYPPDDFVLPDNHIFQPSYMGKEAVLEVLQLYYESNSFSVCNVEGGLDTLCTPVMPGSERSALEFVPIDHIRDLQIRVKCERCTRTCFATNDDLYERLVTFTLDQEPGLQSTVESLAAFRDRIQTSNAQGLNVEIVLISDLRDVRSETYRVVNMLQTVRNFVYELIHDRGNTTVRITHQDEGLMAFPKNYTGLFQITKEQWDYVSTLPECYTPDLLIAHQYQEKFKQEPNHDWSQDFWLLPIEGDEMDEESYRKFGGYYFTAQEQFLTERWGITDIIRDTSSKSQPVEGFAWPVGCPYNSAHVKEWIESYQRLQE